MAQNENKKESFNTDSTSTDKSVDTGKGPQGVDKAPGEETSQENVQFTQETQKGKKADRDPADEKDEPLEQQDI